MQLFNSFELTLLLQLQKITKKKLKTQKTHTMKNRKIGITVAKKKMKHIYNNNSKNSSQSQSLLHFHHMCMHGSINYITALFISELYAIRFYYFVAVSFVWNFFLLLLLLLNQMVGISVSIGCGALFRCVIGISWCFHRADEDCKTSYFISLTDIILKILINT